MTDDHLKDARQYARKAIEQGLQKALDPRRIVKQEYAIRLQVTRYYEPKIEDYQEYAGYGHYMPLLDPKLQGYAAMEAMARFDKHETDEGGNVLERIADYNPADEDPPEYEFAVVTFYTHADGSITEEVDVIKDSPAEDGDQIAVQEGSLIRSLLVQEAIASVALDHDPRAETISLGPAYKDPWPSYISPQTREPEKGLQ